MKICQEERRDNTENFECTTHLRTEGQNGFSFSKKNCFYKDIFSAHN